ncbi:MAG: hypothetical protein WC069_06200 [Candidatus Shapirobacteria bacterium]
MAAWKSEREEEFLEECSEWGVSILRNGISKTGTKTPDSTDFLMQPHSYLTNVKATFSLLHADFQSLGMTGVRAQFQCEGKNFEIIRVKNDSSDATIQFDCAVTR